MRRLLFLLLIPCVMAGKTHAQVSLEVEGHTSVALEELDVLADGTGFGGTVAVTYSLENLESLDLVARAGFNHYGSKVDDAVAADGSLIPIDSAYQGIPISGGVRFYYGESRKYYVEGLLGVEIKRGDLDVFDLEDETTAIDPVGSMGGGMWVTHRLGIVASFGVSNDLWRYANLGVSLRLGG